jgi:hypothetical protein
MLLIILVLYFILSRLNYIEFIKFLRNNRKMFNFKVKIKEKEENRNIKFINPSLQGKNKDIVDKIKSLESITNVIEGMKKIGRMSRLNSTNLIQNESKEHFYFSKQISVLEEVWRFSKRKSYFN